jgi:hypothetical protein
MGFDCVVIDELSLFKNRGSLRFKAVRRAMRGVPYRVGLTGTPSPNGLVDLWAQAALLDDGEALGGKFGEFADKYFTKRGNGMIVYEYRPRPGAAGAIAARLSPLAFSAGSGLTAAALPPSRVIDERVRLDGGALDAYERLERDLVLDVAGAGVTANGAAALVSKLSQAAGGAVYDDEGGWVKLHDRKVDRAREIVASRPGEPVIIAYQYRHELERLREAFPLARELGKGKAVTGDVEAWNAGEIPVLLVHPASAGHGLNLQFGGHVLIWFAPTWNLEHYLQMNARLVRRGQTREVIIHRLVATGTVDERVITRMLNKYNLQEFLFNEIELIRCKYCV